MPLSQNAIYPDTLEAQPIPSVDHARQGADNLVGLYLLGSQTLMDISISCKTFYSTMPTSDQINQQLWTGPQTLLF